MNTAIILAGGVGHRMGAAMPKQYIEVEGKPIIHYCLKTFLCHPLIDSVVVCIADVWKTLVQKCVDDIHSTKSIIFSRAGDYRQQTIFNALQTLADTGINDDDIVIIHDAVRPLVTDKIITDCITGCQFADGTLPVIPVKDTIYQSADGTSISNLLNRSELFAGQAPEAFLFGKYFQIHQSMSFEELSKINGSSQIAYQNGLNIRLIQGDPINFKITTPDDLVSFTNIVLKKNESL